jgi:pimeloyl-ACP methyl ester carboxylesterase
MFSSSPPRGRIAALVLSAAVVLGVQAAQVPASALGGGPSCQQVIVPVALSPSDSTAYHVAGWLCADGSPAGKIVQVLVHGGTYDHRYWDWPQSPQQYSYIRSATDAGYATFSYDRIGVGASDHPLDGNSVTIEVAGFVLHQVVQGLRSGGIGGTAFGQVVTVGHSFGSAAAVVEASEYDDVQGVILSGYEHEFPPRAITAITEGFYPAPLDPQFAAAGLNNTYLTTVPSARGQLFFDPINADDGVVSLDESIKQTATTGEFLADPNAFATSQITVPVLLAIGQNDILACDPSVGLSCADAGAFLAREGSNYTPQSCLEAFVLPNAGHVINLHPNSHLWFEAASRWVDRHVGATPPTSEAGRRSPFCLCCLDTPKGLRRVETIRGQNVIVY